MSHSHSRERNGACSGELGSACTFREAKLGFLLLMVLCSLLVSLLVDTANISNVFKSRMLYDERESGSASLPGSQLSAFDQAFHIAYGDARPSQTSQSRRRFNITNFQNKSDGGLKDADRFLLGDLYYKADSVFEFGVGESTRIAAYTNVPRYVGVDSSATWVSMARESAPHRFRFYFADIGPTRRWGFPLENLNKSILNYQVGPLHMEQDAFDIYLVDGRWRTACVALSFMHAVHCGADMEKVRVVLHDYNKSRRFKKSYSMVEKIADIEQRTQSAIVLKLKTNFQQQELFDLWQNYSSLVI